MFLVTNENMGLCLYMSFCLFVNTRLLMLFGEVISEISEETYVDKDDPNSKSLPPIGNGTYVVKMKLKKDILLPLPKQMVPSSRVYFF